MSKDVPRYGESGAAQKRDQNERAHRAATAFSAGWFAKFIAVEATIRRRTTQRRRLGAAHRRRIETARGFQRTRWQSRARR